MTAPEASADDASATDASAADAPPPLPDLARHPYFTAFRDPQSGVLSWFLTERLAPVQQSFYFTNPCIDGAGARLWCYLGYPPNRQRHLAAIDLDPDAPMVRRFPQAPVEAVSPMIEPDGGACYFTVGPRVWRIDLEGATEAICELDADYIAGRTLHRLASHLSRSADGRYFLLDGEVGNHWFVALGEVETGAVRVLKEFRMHHNHAQFSPVDPDRFEIAMDWCHDRVTGRRSHYDNRMWLMNTAGTLYETLCPENLGAPYKGICHEWWSPDGWICYVDYERGVYELEVDRRARSHVWRRPICHAHCNRDRTLWVGDQSPYFWDERPCEVLFYDRAARRETAIFSALPRPALERGPYHLDPHPQFVAGDRWIASTATLPDGAPTIAITPVAPLVAD